MVVADPDAVVVGSGPNGLAAAVALAQNGAAVLVVEAADEIGGGTRTGELTLPGFRHDLCSAVHPMGILSPYLRSLPLAEHGLEWIRPPASVAHPLDRLACELIPVVAQQGAERVWSNANTPRSEADALPLFRTKKLIQLCFQYPRSCQDSVL